MAQMTTKDQKVDLVEEFYNVYGRLPKYSEKWKNVAVGRFLVEIRYGSIKIAEGQMSRLKELGFTMEKRNVEESKEESIQLIGQFYEMYGRLPKQTEKSSGRAIGIFLANIKQGNIKIAEEQMSRLKELGFTMEKRNTNKEEKISLIEQFYEMYGRLPTARETVNGIQIGRFLNSIRQGDTKITKEQMRRLKVLEFTVEKRNIEKMKDEKIQLIEQFYYQFRRLPKYDEKWEGVAIGNFLMRIKWRKVKITEQQEERLGNLGFERDFMTEAERQELLERLKVARKSLITTIENKKVLVKK